MKKWIIFFLITFAFLQAKVQDSTVPLLERISPEHLIGKINKNQQNKINKIEPQRAQKLRIMTYNMLFNLPHVEEKLDEVYHWRNRLPRIVEYLKFSKPDIIGTQELYADQIKDLMNEISHDYNYYGIGRKGKLKGEVQAIFYRKNRLELIDYKTFFMSKSPNRPSKNKEKNTLVYAKFKDKKTGKEFIVLNTHLSFADIKKRLYEARFINKTIQSLPKNVPIILTGDFNTFPAIVDLDVPFHDGENIVHILTNNQMCDCKQRSALGHIGPIATTNFDQKTKQNFIGNGTPGVILDRIFVSSKIMVWIHAVDPARVDGYFGSDHYPVIAEVILP